MILKEKNLLTLCSINVVCSLILNNPLTDFFFKGNLMILKEKNLLTLCIT